MTAVVDSVSTGLAIAPVRTRGQRWRRRYGLAAAGAAIILAWVAIALFAPLLTPYQPDTVEVTSRLQPRLECTYRHCSVIPRC